MKIKLTTVVYPDLENYISIYYKGYYIANLDKISDSNYHKIFNAPFGEVLELDSEERFLRREDALKYIETKLLNFITKIKGKSD
jgi:hypothetical protein